VFPGTKGQGCLTFHIDNDFPLPISWPEQQLSLEEREGEVAFLNVTNADNANLTPAQKELLWWHFKLGHFNLAWIQSFMQVQEGDNELAVPTALKASLCSILFVWHASMARHISMLSLVPTKSRN